MSEGGPMRVCYVTETPVLVGTSRSLLDILGGLNRDLVSPFVVLREDGPLVDKLDELGVEHAVFPYPLATISPRGFLENLAKVPYDYLAARRLSRFFASSGFDLVHNNTLLVDAGMRAARMAGIPYVCHIREFVSEDHGREFLNEAREFELIRGSAAVIAISEAVARKFRPLAPQARFEVMHNGMTVERYLRPRLPILANSAIRLLVIGRVAPGKRQLDAVRALEALRSRGVDVRLTVAGFGEGTGDRAYQEEVRAYVSGHGLGGAVDLAPFCDDVSGYYAKSDVLLMCSKSEGMGRVTVEGMLAGCLVVGADSGATPELVHDGETGLLYESGSPQVLADRIMWALSHAEEARNIASEAQTWAAREFDSRHYVERLTAIYGELASFSGGNARK